jgi:DNA-binding GntR family transcriptional regulator
VAPDGQPVLDGALAGPRTAHEAVVEALRRALLAGGYAGGTRLVQSEVAAQLGVSNTPVREAMRQLAAEGLLQFDRYRGFVVHLPTEAEIRELYELRLLLEPVAISKAARHMTDDELARARDLHTRAQATAELGDWVVLNRQFHGALIDGAHSPRLSSIVGSLKDIALTQAWLFITSPQGAMEASNAEHAELLHVVEARDPERAARLVTRHLEAALRTIGSSTRARTKKTRKGQGG